MKHRNKLSDRKWDSILRTMERRDFIRITIGAGVATFAPRFVSAAAGKPYKLGLGVATFAPRFVSAAAGKPYKLGLLLPVTGTGANYADGAIKAVMNATAEINSRGGLLGKHPIEVSYRDTHTKPDVAAREARDVISRDNVQTVAPRRNQQQLEDRQRELHALHLPVLPQQPHAVRLGGGGGRRDDQGKWLEDLCHDRSGL
jgi:hypothetical protein